MSLSEEVINLMEDGIKSQASLKLLVDFTKEFDKGIRAKTTSSVNITQIKLLPSIGVKKLLIRSVTDKDWQQVVEGLGIEFVEAKDTDHPIEVLEPTSGKTWYMNKMSYAGTPATVRCNCPDFTYTFAYNVKNKLHALTNMQLKAYIKKSDRPSRNPANYPGLCKHLLALVDVLAKSGRLKA